MKQADLEKLYRSWNDEKLIETYKKRFDYTETAQTALLRVIEERELMEAVDKAIWDDLGKMQQAEEAGKKAFEEKILGEFTDAKVFAEKSRIKGVYMRGHLVKSAPTRLRAMLLGCALFFLVMSIIFLFAVEGFLFVPLTGIGVGILLFIYSIRLHEKSEGTFLFYRKDQEDFFEVRQGKFLFRAKIPFKYFVYYSTSGVVGAVGNKKQHVTGIVISNQEKTIGIEANIYRLSTPPPCWRELTMFEIPEGTNFFAEEFRHRIDIVKLKKILDGLHDEENKYI